jgi:hypothetical protein
MPPRSTAKNSALDFGMRTIAKINAPIATPTPSDTKTHAVLGSCQALSAGARKYAEMNNRPITPTSSSTWASRTSAPRFSRHVRFANPRKRFGAVIAAAAPSSTASRQTIGSRHDSPNATMTAPQPVATMANGPSASTRIR